MTPNELADRIIEIVSNKSIDSQQTIDALLKTVLDFAIIKLEEAKHEQVINS